VQLSWVVVSHGPLHDTERLEPDFAFAVADTMQALATASRVRILGRLRAGAQTVGELAAAVGMEPSAVSHQLRVLRHLGFVVGRRDGRHVVYDLYDDHVAHLLDEAVSHVEHVQLGLAGRGAAHRTTELAS
jgi:DNA-binding transcriptional ArsR family regulator